MKHLLSIADLSRDEIISLLDEADRFREVLEGREVKKLPTLRGRTIFTLFYENSTRTRSSFETAGKWMSADVINISASSSSVKKGESLKDTGLTLSAIGADAIIMRHPSSGAAQQLAGYVAPGGVGPSVINAGDGSHQHPTQALLDALTIRQRLGGIEGRKIVLVGDVLRACGGQVLAHVISTDGQLAVSAVNEDGKLDVVGATQVSQRIQCGADGTSGEQHIINQNNGGLVYATGGDGCGLQCAVWLVAEIITVEGDVNGAGINTDAREFFNLGCQALCQGNTTRGDSQKHDPVRSR